MLVGTGPRGRDGVELADAIAARLAEEGVAEATAVAEAITALRVAIAETPRRGTVGQHVGQRVGRGRTPGRGRRAVL